MNNVGCWNTMVLYHKGAPTEAEELVATTGYIDPNQFMSLRDDLVDVVTDHPDVDTFHAAVDAKDCAIKLAKQFGIRVAVTYYDQFEEIYGTETYGA